MGQVQLLQDIQARESFRVQAATTPIKVNFIILARSVTVFTNLEKYKVVGILYHYFIILPVNVVLGQ